VGIVDEDIARVRAATDFVALAGEHLALKRVGRGYVGLCPFHGEKSPSFSVNAELGLYYCFGCQARGDVITFVRETEHLDFVEAVELLAGRAGIALRYDDEATGRDHQRRTKIHENLERAIEWYHDRLLRSPDAAAARGYLRRERGYDSDVVRRYRLGWAPEGWDVLVRSLRLPPAALADAGLAFVNDRGNYTDFFRGRILFPIFEPGGRPVGAGGRMLPEGRPPKYKNTANTAVYDKSRTLYGLNWGKDAVVKRGQVVVCEGYTDVIGLQRAGVEEAVATCGTALAEGHIRALTNFARRIILAYDADAAGQSAADKVAEWEQRFEVDIRVAALPAGADPADLARSDPDALRAAIAGARPYLAFRLQRLFSRSDLSTAEGRVRAATEAAAMVGAHPNELIRDQYLMEVADRCRLDATRLRQLVASGSLGNTGSVSGGRDRGRARDDTRDVRDRDTNRRGSDGRGRGRDERPSTDDRATGGSYDDGSGYAASVDDSGGYGSGGYGSAGYGSAGYGSGGYGDEGYRDQGYRDEPVGRAASQRRAVSSAELEALRLAIQRRELVADRLDAVLFSHPLAVAAFVALCEAETVYEAIDHADPQTALLLQRLAVEEDDVPADSVIMRLVERAVAQAVDELRDEWRADSLAASDSTIDRTYTDIIAWLKLAMETLRTAESEGDGEAARDAEDRLVAWLIAREDARRGVEADSDVDEGAVAIREEDGSTLDQRGLPSERGATDAGDRALVSERDG
jgi:DNA primase